MTAGGASGPDELWARTDALFQKALDLPPSRWSAFLDEATDDEAVRARVRRLLDIDRKAAGFLEEDEVSLPPEIIDDLAARAGSELAAGTSLGRYEVVDVLGRGGTSTVYRARRADGTFEQEVAIKVLRRDLRIPELADRMRTERQILASLSHPNLAKVFDGGVAEDGRPFLVVELVPGLPLDAYCDERKLPLRGRLEIFIQVLDAVQHAHRNLVVHRDLKPSNILVEPDGRVKLLDFGVAKLLQTSEEDATTATKGRWLTPSYAAPEQVLGGPITTATDIHALGVILYEILTGRRPFIGASGSAFEVERAICETDPAPPSTAVTRNAADTEVQEFARRRSTNPRELATSLGGDLDAVVLTALRKEPERRYASAEVFARDLRSFLDGRPVSARGDSATYRLGKFVRRHWLTTSAAALLALTVLASAVALALSRDAILAERDRAAASAETARQEAENAQAVVAFLADVFRGRDPNAAPSDTVTALELVEWAEGRVSTEFEERPEVRAQLLGVLGDAFENLGFAQRGLELHDRSYLETVRIHGVRSREGFEALRRLTDNRRFDRNFLAALPPAHAAVAVARVLEPADPARLVEALSILGTTTRDLGNPDSAAVYLEEAVRLADEAGLADSPDHVHTVLALAYVRRSQGRWDEAERHYRDGIRRARSDSDLPASTLSSALNNLAFLLRERGDYVGADSLYAEALDITSEVFGRGHPNTVLVARNLAGVRNLQGRAEATQALLAENLRASRALFGDDHWRVASASRAVGLHRLRQGDVATALPRLDEAVRIFRSTLGEDHNWTIFTEAGLEAARRVSSGTAEADDGALQRALDLARTWHTSGNGRILPSGRNLIEPLVMTLEALGMSEQAAPFQALLSDDAS